MLATRENQSIYRVIYCFEDTSISILLVESESVKQKNATYVVRWREYYRSEMSMLALLFGDSSQPQ